MIQSRQRTSRDHKCNSSNPLTKHSDSASLSSQRTPILRSNLSNRSRTSLRSVQSANRLRSIKPVKELARRASRLTLRGNSQRSLSDDKGHNVLKHYNSCSPPKLTRPPQLSPPQSNYSSFESLSVDRSGASTTQLTHLTTPSPGKSLAPDPSHATLSSLSRAMGQESSSLREKKSNASPRKSSLDAFSNSPPPSPSGLTRKATEVKPPVQVVRLRPNSVQVPIPRRRSSLTVIHLDSSHFGSADSGRTDLKHRASTLTTSSHQEPTPPTIIAPLGDAVTRGTFSPPIPAPATATGRPTSSQCSSVASLRASHIYFPKTFPNGMPETPKPPIMKTHHACYSHHRRMLRSSNEVCPVPCMTCGAIEGIIFWKCVWCDLRVCGECMAEFNMRRRKVAPLLEWIQKRSRPSSKGSRFERKEDVGKNGGLDGNAQVAGPRVSEILEKVKNGNDVKKLVNPKSMAKDADLKMKAILAKKENAGAVLNAMK